MRNAQSFFHTELQFELHPEARKGEEGKRATALRKFCKHALMSAFWHN
jgi:hypothetical protein